MKLILNSKQISFLRGLAHKLDPVVTIGNNGVSEGVVKELEFTLKTFELIKIKLRCDDQDELLALVSEVTESVKAIKVQVIGHTLVLYRRSVEPKIPVPGLPLPEVKVTEAVAPKKKLSFRKTATTGGPEGRKPFPKVYKKSAPRREKPGADKRERPGAAKREKPATGRGFSKGFR